jgi:L-aspartate oxidase
VVEVVSRSQTKISPAPWLEEKATSEARFEEDVRELMWERCGLERSASGLHRAALDLDEMSRVIGSQSGELASLLLVARMVVRAATARTESRGAHYRSDFPRPSGCWLQPLVFEGERMLQPHPIGFVTVSG